MDGSIESALMESMISEALLLPPKSLANLLEGQLTKCDCIYDGHIANSVH